MSRPFLHNEAITSIIADWHFTADEIYQKLRANNPSIGKWALYRNLDHLVENEVLMKTAWLKKAYVFETYKAPHSHILCKKSGMIFDVTINIDVPSELLPEWFNVEEQHMVILWTFGNSKCNTHISE